MRPAHDLVIRHGLIVDGGGGAPFPADVAIDGDRISRVGKVTGRGRLELSARDHLVTPGFVDVHTHYDGQVTWSDRLVPSSWHGVTTAVMGNCGVGFAPCAPAHRALLVHLMEGVEDIPEIVLNAGLPWTWESFPQYLDFLASRQYDIDLCAQLPHAPLRVAVMGERGARREPATADDCNAMARLAREAITAGAFGFSTSRALAHKTAAGEHTPTYDAGEAELLAIALALRDAGRGVLQFVTDISEKKAAGVAEFAMLRRLVEQSGRPLSLNITQRESDPDGWCRVLAMIDDARGAGLPVTGQVMARAIGLVLGLEASFNPFSEHPTYRAIAHLPLSERVAALRDPAVQTRLLAEQPADAAWQKRCFDFSKLWVLTDPPDYEPPASASLAAQAQARGIDPARLALELLLADEGRTLLYRPLLNYAHGNLDAVLDMLTHPAAVPGIADGGAHCGMVCDAAVPSFALAYWGRDRRGAQLPVEHLIKSHTADSARLVGLTDRGRLLPGWKADLNIIDHARLAVRKPRIAWDMPAGGKRLVQDADGYDATIVSGVITYRHGQATGALPGRLQRAR